MLPEILHELIWCLSTRAIRECRSADLVSGVVGAVVFMKEMSLPLVDHHTIIRAVVHLTFAFRWTSAGTSGFLRWATGQGSLGTIQHRHEMDVGHESTLLELAELIGRGLSPGLLLRHREGIL